MNSKSKISNLTKSLYIILALCIISVVCLSVYSFLNLGSRDSDTKSNSLNLKSDSVDNTESDIMLKRFNTTEPKTQNTNPTLEIATEAPLSTQSIPDNSNLPQPKAPTAPTIPTVPAIPKETNLPVEKSEESVSSDEPANIDYPIETPDNVADDAVETLAVPSFFLKPLAGSVSKIYNEDTPEYSVIMNDYRTHLGIDIESEVGVNVKAVADGVITEIYDDPMMGKVIVISHAGEIESVYMNLLETLPQNISVGSIVGTGDVIGGVGESSLIEVSDVPHLHFAMKKEGKFIDPLEYVEY